MKTVTTITLSLIASVCFSQVTYNYYSSNDSLISDDTYNTSITYIIKADKITQVMDGVMTMFKIISVEEEVYKTTYANRDTLHFTFLKEDEVLIEYSDNTYNIVTGAVRNNLK